MVTVSRILTRTGLGRLRALDPTEPANRFETPRPAHRLRGLPAASKESRRRGRKRPVMARAPESGSTVSAGARATLREAARADDSYGLLLGLLLLTYAFSASGLEGRGTTLVSAGLSALTLLLAFRTSRVPHGYGLNRAAYVLAVVVPVAGIVGAVRDEDLARGVAGFAVAFLLGLSVCAVTWSVVSASRVSLRTILGAVSVYLMLAFMFATTYSAIQSASGDDFFVTGFGERAEMIYYSLVTLTTIGYGDFTAAANLGRSLSAFEGFLGQMFIAVLLARLVALYRVSGKDSAG